MSDARITEEQIDMLWKRRSFYSTEPIDDCIAALGIVACEECDGMGHYQEIDHFEWVDCEVCRGHGWVSGSVI